MGLLHSTYTVKIADGVTQTHAFRFHSPVVFIQLETDGRLSFSSALFGKQSSFKSTSGTDTGTKTRMVTVNGTKTLNPAPIAFAGSGDYEVVVTNASGAEREYQVDVIEQAAGGGS